MGFFIFFNLFTVILGGKHGKLYMFNPPHLAELPLSILIQPVSTYTKARPKDKID